MRYIIFLFACLFWFYSYRVPIENESKINKLDTMVVEGLWIKSYFSKPKSSNIDNPYTLFFIATNKPDTIDVFDIVNNSESFFKSQNSWYLDGRYSELFSHYFPTNQSYEKWEYTFPTYNCNSYKYKGKHFKTAIVKYKSYLLRVPTIELFDKQLFLNYKVNPLLDTTNVFLFYQVLEQNCYYIRK